MNRRQFARRRRWTVWRQHQRIYSMRNPDRLLPNGTIEPGLEFTLWSVRPVRMHG